MVFEVCAKEPPKMFVAAWFALEALVPPESSARSEPVQLVLLIAKPVIKSSGFSRSSTVNTPDPLSLSVIFIPSATVLTSFDAIMSVTVPPLLVQSKPGRVGIIPISSERSV